MELAIGIQTAPRPVGFVHLGESLRSLRTAGFDAPVHIFAEPATELQDTEACHVVQHANCLGCFQNWKFGLSWLLRNTGADWLLMLQDDIAWRQDGWNQLQSGMQAHPAAGALSAYTSRKMVDKVIRNQECPNEHWREAHFWDNAFVGALALCLPRASAARLLKNKLFQSHSHHRKVDVVVGNVLRHALRLPLLVRLPSLVEHIGNDFSTLGRHRIREIQWGRRAYHWREMP